MKPDRKTAIVVAACDLLEQEGGHQLTMRKVAARVGISLGNLQYHYANRDRLLEALLADFLAQYAKDMQSRMPKTSGNWRSDLSALIEAILSDPGFDRCARLFREIWALTQHGDGQEQILTGYYSELQQFYAASFRQLVGSDIDQANIDHAVAVAMPMIEGYCVTGTALGQSPSETAPVWGRVIADILSADLVKK